MATKQINVQRFSITTSKSFKDVVARLRLVAGNPVIMKQMVKFVPDASSCAPVTILVERATGWPVHFLRRNGQFSHALRKCRSSSSSKGLGYQD